MMYESNTYCTNMIRVKLDGVVGFPVMCSVPIPTTDCRCKSCQANPDRIIERQKPRPAEAS